MRDAPCGRKSKEVRSTVRTPWESPFVLRDELLFHGIFIRPITQTIVWGRLPRSRRGFTTPLRAVPLPSIVFGVDLTNWACRHTEDGTEGVD